MREIPMVGIREPGTPARTKENAGPELEVRGIIASFQFPGDSQFFNAQQKKLGMAWEQVNNWEWPGDEAAGQYG